MSESRLAREARRRPEMDLLVGAIEAGSAHAADRPVDAEEPAVPSKEPPEPPDQPEEPAWREDG